MQERDQPASDRRIVPQPVETPDVRPPQRREAGRLGPQPQDVMVVVFQDDPASRPHGPRHGAHHGERIGEVLEEETGVGHVERSPFGPAERQVEGVAPAPFDETSLAPGAGGAHGGADLLGAALDPEDAAGMSRRARHGAGELPEAAADLQDPLAPPQPDLRQRRSVDQVVETGEPRLLARIGAVQVA